MGTVTDSLTRSNIAILALLYCHRRFPDAVRIVKNRAAILRFSGVIGTDLVKEEYDHGKWLLSITEVGERVLKQYPILEWVLALSEGNRPVEAALYIDLLGRKDLPQLLVHEDEFVRRAARVRMSVLSNKWWR